MKRYILDAPLTPPKDTSDAAERLHALVEACGEIIADGKVTTGEADGLRRWLSAAGWLNLAPPLGLRTTLSPTRVPGWRNWQTRQT